MSRDRTGGAGRRSATAGWACVSLLGLPLTGLPGCASIPNDPPPTNNLVTAVATLSQAESGLYDQIIAVSAATHRSAFVRAFTTKDTGADHTASLFLASTPEGYEKAKAMRMQLMSQLSNYAQVVNAIATSASTAWPSSEVTSTADDANALANTLTGGTGPGKYGPELDVINQIASLVVSDKSASEVKTLASQAAPALKALQTVIDNDNTLITEGIVQGLIPAQQADIQQIIKKLYIQPGTPLDRMRLAVSLYTAIPAPVTLMDTQQMVSDAMSKVVGANAALAANDPKTAAELLGQAEVAANLALQLENSIHTTK